MERGVFARTGQDWLFRRPPRRNEKAQVQGRMRVGLGVHLFLARRTITHTRGRGFLMFIAMKAGIFSDHELLRVVYYVATKARLDRRLSVCLRRMGLSTRIHMIPP